MTKFKIPGINAHVSNQRKLKFNADMYLTPPISTFDDLRDNERIKRALKRAVQRDRAPQRLIDAIRAGIRG